MTHHRRLPIFYINLAHREDRRAFLETQLDALGLACQRIEAVSVAHVPAALAAICADPDTPWRINLPTVACALSHRSAWQAIVDSGLPAGIVLEDDVLIAPSMADFLAPDILDTVGAPLLRLETWGTRVRLASRRTRLAGGSEAAMLITTQAGGAAYVISSDLARRSLDDPRSYAMEADRYLFGRGGRWLLETPVAQAIPAPCVQLGNHNRQQLPPVGQSDIAGPGSQQVEQSALARRRRTAANQRYVLHVASRLLADPVALVTPPAPVPFAGDAAPTSRFASTS